jgi:hypothetical protein
VQYPVEAVSPAHLHQQSCHCLTPALIVINCCRRRRGCGTRWRRCPRASLSPSTEPSLPHPSLSLPNPRLVRIVNVDLYHLVKSFSDPVFFNVLTFTKNTRNQIFFILTVLLTRVVDPDPEPDPEPYWIRIRIGSVFNRVCGSGSGSVFRIRIQEGKNDPQK